MGLKLFLSLIQLAFASQVPFSLSPSHQVSAVSRTLQLGGALARDSITYSLEPASASGASIYVAIPQEEKDKLCWVEAWEGREADKKKKAAVVEEVGFDQESHSYIYSLSLPDSSNTRHITLSLLHSRPSIPHPPTLPQAADSAQFMLWTGSLNLGLPLHSRPSEINIKVKTPTPRIRAHGVDNDEDDVWASKLPIGSNTIAYTISDLKLLKEKNWIAKVQYEAAAPVVIFRNLERIVQVSHWANTLGVSEAMTLVNAGPKLEGHFSRLAHQAALFMKRTTSLTHILTSLSFILPPSIKNTYYIDTVGNVSTSNFLADIKPPGHFPSSKGSKGYSRLDIFPRYPVLGGWNYSFEIGYDAPLSESLKYKDGKYVLQVPFITPVRDVAVEDAKLEIRLPEGATDIEVHTPFPVDSSMFQTSRTYLDSTGRPTIVLTKTNVADKHGIDILVTYKYSQTALFKKPLTVSAVLFGFFALVIGLKRIEWVIG